MNKELFRFTYESLEIFITELDDPPLVLLESNRKRDIDCYTNIGD